MAQSESRVELRSVYIFKGGWAQKPEVSNDRSRGSLLRGERRRAALEARVLGWLQGKRDTKPIPQGVCGLVSAKRELAIFCPPTNTTSMILDYGENVWVSGNLKLRELNGGDTALKAFALVIRVGAVAEQLSGLGPILGPVGCKHPATDLSSSRIARKWVRFEMPPR